MSSKPCEEDDQADVTSPIPWENTEASLNHSDEYAWMAYVLGYVYVYMLKQIRTIEYLYNPIIIYIE